MPTRLFDSGEPDVLYVLDVHCWMHRYFRTMGGRSAHGFIEMVGKVVRDQEPAFMAAATDLRWPTFRHELAPRNGDGKTGYKAHREAPDPVFLERARWARELLQDYFGIKLYAKRGFEADDLIATIVSRAREAGMRVVIVAIDKDLMQLVDGETVLMYDPTKRFVVGPDEVSQKFNGLRPDQVRDFLTIVGDSSDNVPGIYGAGPKAAVEILREFDTLDNALEHAHADKLVPFFEKKPRYRELLRADPERVTLSKRLVTLVEDVPISFDREELRVT